MNVYRQLREVALAARRYANVCDLTATQMEQIQKRGILSNADELKLKNTCHSLNVACEQFFRAFEALASNMKKGKRSA